MSTQIVPAKPPAVRPVFDTDLAQVIGRQLGRIRRREWTPLGALEKLFVEPSGVADLSPGSSLTGNQVRCASLDWYHSGPLLVISEDQREILIASPIAAPPPIPDPAFQRSVIYHPDGSVEDREPTPLIPQRPEELAAGVMVDGERTWLVLQPVKQLLVIAGQGRGWIHVNFRADAQGRHACLLWDPARSRGHFLYGIPDLVRYQ